MKNSAIVRIVIWSAVIVFLIAAAVVVMVNGWLGLQHRRRNRLGI